MKITRLIGLAALLLLAAPAAATTYWVSPTGVAGRSGADSTTNATTLAWVNANAGPGDIVRFKSGVYTDEINPARTNMNASRLRFYGFPQDPGAVRVQRIYFKSVCDGRGSYCTARWITSATEIVVENCYGFMPVADSVVACRALSGGATMIADRAVLDSLVVTWSSFTSGQVHGLNMGGPRTGDIPSQPFGYTTNCVVKNSTFNFTVNTSGDFHGALVASAKGDTIRNNTFNITVTNCSGFFFALEQYVSYDLWVMNNAFNVVVNGPISGSRGVWCMRDSTRRTRYIGNTVSVTGNGSGNLSFLLTNSGQAGLENTTGWSLYSGNNIRDDIPTPGAGVFYWYNGARFDTLRFNVIRTSAAEPIIKNLSGQDWNGTLIHHNTFDTQGPNVVQLEGSLVGNSPRLVSNVYYSTSPNSAGNAIVKVASGTRVDSAGVFFARGGDPAYAIRYNGVDGTPGTGGNFGIAGKALWCSPQFVDSSYAAFNGSLRPGSCAQGGSLQDGFAGALGVQAGDTTPPSAVGDLLASPAYKGVVNVSWTAPGDDGSSGSALYYDVRYRTDPVTTATWDDTTRGGTGVQGRTYSVRYPIGSLPLPAVAGSAESITLVLRPGATYYFAVRAVDDGGNVGAISNTDSVTVPNGVDTMLFPAFYSYGAAGPAGAYPEWYPYLQFDGTTKNTAELDKFARYPIVVINPETIAADSLAAVADYLRWRNPNIKLLHGAAPDVAYYNVSGPTKGYRRQVYEMLAAITPLPATFSLPYSSTYGIPQGYGASPDTTTPSAFLWSRVPGRKNAWFGTLKLPCPCASGSGVYANAGVSLRTINLGYRDAFGRFAVAESLAYLEKRLYYDVMYTGRDGKTRRLWDGSGRDLHSYDITSNNTFNGTDVDSLDWLRMGYSSRADADQGFRDGAVHFDRVCARIMPEFDWFGSNGFAFGGQDHASGGLLEGLPGQMGGTVESNLERKPGGHIWNAYSTARRPLYLTVAASPSTDAISDTGMVAAFNPDTSWARQEFRLGTVFSCIVGGYYVYGESRFSAANNVGHPKGNYYAWTFDERAANRGTGQALDMSTVASKTDIQDLAASAADSSGYLGRPTSDPYGHYPAAAGAIFTSSLAAGASPDSSIWQTLQKNAAGRATVRPGGPAGFSYYLEVQPAAEYGVDWQLAALSKSFAVTSQDYTISFWVRADTTRFFSIGFRDSATGGVWSGVNGTGRAVLATPTWRPECVKVFSGGSSANVQLAAYFADTLGRVQLTGFQVHPGDSTMKIREFEYGVVLLNPSTFLTHGHTFPRMYRRLTARTGVWQNVNNGALSRSFSVGPRDGLVLLVARDTLRPGPPTIAGVDVGGCDRVNVRWTVPGDDSLTGNPITYEIRASSSAITTEAQYAAATIVSGGAAPIAGPTTTTVTGLPVGATRYFSVRVTDDAGFRSALPTSVSATTSGSCSAQTSAPELRPYGAGGIRSRTRRR